MTLVLIEAEIERFSQDDKLTSARTKCSHAVTLDSRVYKSRSALCQKSAMMIVDGACYCYQHAGKALLLKAIGDLDADSI